MTLENVSTVNEMTQVAFINFLLLVQQIDTINKTIEGRGTDQFDNAAHLKIIKKSRQTIDLTAMKS